MNIDILPFVDTNNFHIDRQLIYHMMMPLMMETAAKCFQALPCVITVGRLFPFFFNRIFDDSFLFKENNLSCTFIPLDLLVQIERQFDCKKGGR